MTCPSFTELLVACLDVRGTISSAESKHTHACWSVDRAIPIRIMLLTFPMLHFKVTGMVSSRLSSCAHETAQFETMSIAFAKQRMLLRPNASLIGGELFQPRKLEEPYLSICSPTAVHSTVRQVQPCWELHKRGGLCTTLLTVHNQLKPYVTDYKIFKVKKDDSTKRIVWLLTVSTELEPSVTGWLSMNTV